MGLRSLFPSVTLVLLLALLVCNNICITCFLTPRLPSALHRNRFQRSNNEIYAQFISSSEIENGRESGRECLSKTADHSESNSDYFSSTYLLLLHSFYFSLHAFPPLIISLFLFLFFSTFLPISPQPNLPPSLSPRCE